MISVAAALVLSNLRVPADTVSLTADQDVWVYAHSSDAAGEPYLMAWGVGGKAIADNPDDAESCSYSYLRFSLDQIPAGKKLVGATMILKPMGSPEINPAAKDWPLEVRPLKGTFTEREWSYDVASTVVPMPEIFGTGIIGAVSGSADAKDLEIRVDLMGKTSKFGDAFAAAAKDKKPMYFALTSKYDPSNQGRSGVYRLYSRDNKDESVRPKLVLTFE
ncbi:MAG: hypothetical protein GC165_03435 [Armatimonadetes bacterium]|nr:hypothetical protein [Armatimonadota bacterium]